MKKFDRMVYLYGSEKAVEMLLEDYPMPRHPEKCTVDQGMTFVHEVNQWLKKLERLVGFDVLGHVRVKSEIVRFPTPKPVQPDLLNNSFDSSDKDEEFLALVKDIIESFVRDNEG